MKDKQRQALVRTRAQAILVRRLGERIRAECMVSSPRLDGAPRTTCAGMGLDHRLIRRQALEEMTRRETALLRRYEREARRAMDEMKPEMYAFCALYYIGGASIGETAQAIDRSERQCIRYKNEIERVDEAG